MDERKWYEVVTPVGLVYFWMTDEEHAEDAPSAREVPESSVPAQYVKNRDAFIKAYPAARG